MSLLNQPLHSGCKHPRHPVEIVAISKWVTMRWKLGSTHGGGQHHLGLASPAALTVLQERDKVKRYLGIQSQQTRSENSPQGGPKTAISTLSL